MQCFAKTKLKQRKDCKAKCFITENIFYNKMHNTASLAYRIENQSKLMQSCPLEAAGGDGWKEGVVLSPR